MHSHRWSSKYKLFQVDWVSVVSFHQYQYLAEQMLDVDTNDYVNINVLLVT